jgi:hypothetical protein
VRAKKVFVFLIIFGPLTTSIVFARHPFRTHHPQATNVTICSDGHMPNTLFSNRLRLYPLFAFRTQDVREYLIPQGPITYRLEPTKAVSGIELGKLVERVIAEVVTQKTIIKKARATTDCIVLRDRNFNYKISHGLIILKCKNYPFVVKIFIESPASFFDFRSTGIEPPFFFYMGGGANRHLTGMTRIRNRNLIQETIDALPRWRNHVEIPRKWYWLPEQPKELTLIGRNIGGHEEIKTTIPALYAIIEDEIEIKKETTRIAKRRKRKIIIELCNDLHIYLDPHPHNYAFIEDPKTKQFKIALVDTEHFPTMAGIETKVTFRDHMGWYTYLAKNYLRRLYGLTKKDLIVLQGQVSEVSIHQPIRVAPKLANLHS